MKTFEYTIKDELGIHARPAGLLVKEAKKFESECTITKDGKTKKLTQLMMLMSLGVKQGDTVTVTAEGADEEAAAAALKEFFENNSYPKDSDLEYLSKLLLLSPRVIVVWFQVSHLSYKILYKARLISIIKHTGLFSLRS